jgi:hypothetical protein
MQEQLMTVSQFMTLIETLPNSYENPQGVEIDGVDDICCRINVWTEGPTKFTLWVEMEPAKFIAELNIRSMADLDAITEADLWAQYLKGNGTVWADLDYLGGKSLRFNVVGNRTAITGDQMDYTDELNGVWCNAQQFKGYVREHIQKI